MNVYIVSLLFLTSSSYNLLQKNTNIFSYSITLRESIPLFFNFQVNCRCRPGFRSALFPTLVWQRIVSLSVTQTSLDSQMTVIACISLISSVLQVFPTFYHRVSFLKHSARGRCTTRKKCALRHRHFMSSLIRANLIVTSYYPFLYCQWCYEERLLQLRIRGVW